MPIETLGEIVRFAPNAYGVRYGNYVSVFFVSPEGVILVDPCGQVTPRMPSLISDAIRTVTDARVKYVVYSHWGSDHGRGGALFADTAQFVGHRATVAKIIAAQDPNSPVPQIAVDHDTVLSLGGTNVHLYPTEFFDGDDYLIVYEPESKVVMTVDFVQPCTVPFRRLFGVPSQVVARLQWLEDTLEIDAVVSGHGLQSIAGTREDLREQRQYYVDLGDAIAQAKGQLETVRAILAPKYGTWRRFDQMIADNVQGYMDWTRPVG